MEKNDLEKLNRISTALHDMTPVVIKETGTRIDGFKKLYDSYYELVNPIELS